MTTDRRHPAATTFVPGNTKTDFRLTRAPADTPRGRLHRAAAVGARVARVTRKTLMLSSRDMEQLRTLARRAYKAVHLDRSRGASLVMHICYGLDQTVTALAPFLELDVPRLCEELTGALVQLEAAEFQIEHLNAEIATMNRELAIERGHNEQLRASLAAEAVRTANAIADIAPDRFDEVTRSRTLTTTERGVVADPDAT